MVLIAIFRWGGRLLASAAAALVVAFVVGEGIGDVRALTDVELGGMAAVIVMLIGTLVALRWELTGGALLLLGYVAFTLIDEGWPPLPFAAFAVAGVVLLLAGILRRVRTGRSSAPEPATAAPPPAA